jgi:hypothetical protein
LRCDLLPAEKAVGGPESAPKAESATLTGFKNAGSCCDVVVFVDESAKSVASMELLWRVTDER